MTPEIEERATTTPLRGALAIMFSVFGAYALDRLLRGACLHFADEEPLRAWIDGLSPVTRLQVGAMLGRAADVLDELIGVLNVDGGDEIAAN